MRVGSGWPEVTRASDFCCCRMAHPRGDSHSEESRNTRHKFSGCSTVTRTIHPRLRLIVLLQDSFLFTSSRVMRDTATCQINLIV